MGYTIKAIAAKLGLTTYTLRYYEKEGLLPTVERDQNGNRVFTEHDIEWLQLICCLRDTGMPVNKIKRYVVLCQEGDRSIAVRREIIFRHKQAVEQRIEQMNGCLVRINKKLECYDEFVEAKGVDGCNPFNSVKKANP